jgi:hypothetical protein
LDKETTAVQRRVEADEVRAFTMAALAAGVLRATATPLWFVRDVRSRLDLVAADIDRALTPSHARAVVLLAVRAVCAWHPADPSAREAVAALEAGDWRAARALRPVLEAIAARLDAAYLKLYAAGGDQNTPPVIEAFSRARALDALVMALQPDEVLAARESLYEAHAALGDPSAEDLLTAVRSALATS